MQYETASMKQYLVRPNRDVQYNNAVDSGKRDRWAGQKNSMIAVLN